MSDIIETFALEIGNRAYGEYEYQLGIDPEIIITHTIAYFQRTSYQSKWNLISFNERVNLLRDVITMSEPETALKCVICGTTLDTEADFAIHFYVPNKNYKNLGYCSKIPNPDFPITMDGLL